MSSVEQRVDPLNGGEATLDSHEISTPSSAVTTPLDLEQGHSTDSEIERVIQAERQRILDKTSAPVAEPERPRIEVPRDAPEESPRLEQLVEKKVIVADKEPLLEEVRPTPVTKAAFVQEVAPEREILIPMPKAEAPEAQAKIEIPIRQPIEIQPLAREPEVSPDKLVKTVEPEATLQVAAEPIAQREMPTENSAPVQLTARDANAPTPEPAPRVEPIIERVEPPPVQQSSTPVTSAAPEIPLTLEEKIEKIRAELNIKAPALEYDFKAERPRQVAREETTIALEQAKPQMVERREEPELLMEERPTLTLEQAMKFDFASAKIGTGQKTPQLTFRGHSFGSGTMLDKLITYLADFIKRLEMKLILFLTRRRLEPKSRSVKVVSAEEENDGLSLESFSRSLSKERKRRNRFFGRLFSRFSK